MPAGTLQVVPVNSPVHVLAGGELWREREGKLAERDDKGLGGELGCPKGKSHRCQVSRWEPTPLLARPCQQLAAAIVSMPARLRSPALIQGSWVPVNPGMVLVRRSSTKANS